MGFKSAKGGGKGSKAARRNVGGDKSDAHKRKAEEAFMSPLEVMRQKYLRKKAGNTARQKDVRPWRSHRLRLFCAARLVSPHRLVRRQTLAKLASFKTRALGADGDEGGAVRAYRRSVHSAFCFSAHPKPIC